MRVAANTTKGTVVCGGHSLDWRFFAPQLRWTILLLLFLGQGRASHAEGAGVGATRSGQIVRTWVFGEQHLADGDVLIMQAAGHGGSARTLQISRDGTGRWERAGG